MSNHKRSTLLPRNKEAGENTFKRIKEIPYSEKQSPFVLSGTETLI